MQKGLMAEIKEHLKENVSSGELIAIGYRPATVYKAQRAWRDAQRQESEPQYKLVNRAETGRPEIAASEQSEEQTEDDSNALQSELEMLRLQVEGHEATINELDKVVLENEGLKRQIAVLELETEELARLRQRVGLSEANRHFSRHAQAKLQQQLNSTEQQLEIGSEQRTELEQQVVGAKAKIVNLANENAQVSEQLRLHQQHIGRLTTELQGTMPLKVWAGHPCSACRKPMSGVVSHDTAATLLRDFGHATCLEQRNSNLGKWLLGSAAAIYGISRIR